MTRQQLAKRIANAIANAGGCVYAHEDGSVNYYATARAAGCDPRTVQRIVTGQLSPSLETLERLLSPLGISVEVVLS